MPDVMNPISEKVVKIGMRILSILKKKGVLITPWNVELFNESTGFIKDDPFTQFKLNSVCELLIEESKEIMGDRHKISAIIARLDPATYKVLNIGYTKDYERLWNKRDEDESIPLAMVTDTYFMEVFDPQSPNPNNPYQPELKFLTDYLILLFGHQVEVANGWITEYPEEGRSGFAEIGMKTMFTTIYTALAAYENDGNPTDIPNYDEEPPFKVFLSRLDIKTFITSTMNYNTDHLFSIDEFIAERQQNHDEL